MGFSQQVYWSSLSLPPPVDQVLSELSGMTRSSWVAIRDMAHGFIELCYPICHKVVIHEEVQNFKMTLKILNVCSGESFFINFAKYMKVLILCKKIGHS